MDIQTEDWGMVPIKNALEEQDVYWERRVRGEIPDTIIFTEHEPVYTAGARLKIQPQLLESCFKVDISKLLCPAVIIDRGGLVTYQGPGILSVYCVFRLGGATIRNFENFLLEAAEALLNFYGIKTVQRCGNPGLYIGIDRKIVSVGLKISRGITRYGITVSLDPDFLYLDPLIPCGLTNVRLTSLARETGREKFSECEKDAIKIILSAEIARRWLELSK